MDREAVMVTVIRALWARLLPGRCRYCGARARWLHEPLAQHEPVCRFE